MWAYLVLGLPCRVAEHRARWFYASSMIETKKPRPVGQRLFRWRMASPPKQVQHKDTATMRSQ